MPDDLHPESQAVRQAEAAAAELAKPAPYVALRYTGPAGSFVPGLPTEGSGPDKSLTPKEVHTRFTRGQYQALTKAGHYTRVTAGTDEPDEDPDVTAARVKAEAETKAKAQAAKQKEAE